jgi:hypothetical protein
VKHVTTSADRTQRVEMHENVAVILKGLRALVVAPDPEPLRTLERLCESHGAMVLVTGREARHLPAARERDVEVAIIDPSLGDDGVELARIMNEDMRLRWARIVWVSCERFVREGAVDLATFAKTVGPSVLAERRLRSRMMDRDSFIEDIEQVGPSRVLRACLDSAPWTISYRGATAEVFLRVESSDRVEAAWEEVGPPSFLLEGDPAVDAFRALRAGSIHLARPNAVWRSPSGVVTRDPDSTVVRGPTPDLIEASRPEQEDAPKPTRRIRPVIPREEPKPPREEEESEDEVDPKVHTQQTSMPVVAVGRERPRSEPPLDHDQSGPLVMPRRIRPTAPRAPVDVAPRAELPSVMIDPAVAVPRLEPPPFGDDSDVRPKAPKPPDLELARLADPTSPAIGAPDPKQAEIDAILANLEPDRLPVASVESTALAIVPKGKRSTKRTRPAFGPDADYSPAATRARPSDGEFYIDDRTRSTEDAPEYSLALARPLTPEVSSAEWSPISKTSQRGAKRSSVWPWIAASLMLVVLALGLAIAFVLGAFGTALTSY